jgi:glutathione peroxidase
VDLYDIPLRTLDGRPATLAEHKGRALLIVNVASQCKLATQYEGLQSLHERFAPRGLSVLGFPCNQFLDKEPGTPEEISAFVTSRYGVAFPLYAKLNVNDPDRHPLFERLATLDDSDGTAGDVEWNFEKFLVAPNGAPVARFRCLIPPDDPSLLATLEEHLPG